MPCQRARTLDRVVVQRDGYRISALGQVARHEATASGKVDALPLKSRYVRFPQACGEREYRHIAGMQWKASEQLMCLLARDPFGFYFSKTEEWDLRCPWDHVLPLIAGTALKD
jgi:hypothetical protein